jgi:uncharacterized repeat protein (TIGR01451 family)
LAALATHGIAAAATPEVTLVLEGPPGPLVPGSTIVYRVHVANPNATTPTGALTVEANIPQHVKVWATTWDGLCDPVRCGSTGGGRFGNVVRWKVKQLEPKASTVLEFSALVDNTAENPPPAPGTVITLDAIVKAGAVKAAGASTSAVVQAQEPPFDLAVSGTTRAAPGGELEYTFRYGNASAAAATGVLHVAIPAGTSVVSASTGAEQKGSAVEWNLGSLPAGRSDWRKLRLKLDAKAKEGSIFLIEPELRGPAKTARRASAATLVALTSPLAIDLSVAPDPAQPGGTLVYKLELTNQSPSSPTGAFIAHAAIPENVHVSSATAGGLCDPIRCGSSGLGGRQGNNVVWKVASLAPSATVELQFTATVDKPSDAAPPPNGTIVRTEATAFVFGGARANLSLAVGTAATAGNGRALAPLAGAPVAQASPPAPATPEAISEPPATIPPPAEEFVEEEEEAEVAAATPDPKAKDKPAKPVKVRHDVRWDKSRKVWNKYCSAKWQKREWDKRCMKRWRMHRDWAKRKAWWKDRWKES